MSKPDAGNASTSYTNITPAMFDCVKKNSHDEHGTVYELADEALDNVAGLRVGLIGCGQWGQRILRDLVALGCEVPVGLRRRQCGGGDDEWSPRPAATHRRALR